MKLKYSKPEITLEELTKADVLCASEVNSEEENFDLIKSIWDDLDQLF